MDTVEKRIKDLRLMLKLSQPEFGKKIGLAQSSLAMIETGHRNVTERTLKQICTEYNVNEVWLRTGEGEAFYQLSKDEEYSLLMEQATAETDPVRKTLIKNVVRTILELPPEAYGIIKQITRDILVEIEENNTKKEIKIE